MVSVAAFVGEFTTCMQACKKQESCIGTAQCKGHSKYPNEYACSMFCVCLCTTKHKQVSCSQQSSQKNVVLDLPCLCQFLQGVPAVMGAVRSFGVIT